MNAINATWKDGRIVPDETVDWPEGCRLVVEPLSAQASKIGLDDAEWQDDSASLADWDAWIRTIEPLELTAEEEARFARFDEQMRRHNVEAVRRQMEQGGVP